MRLFIISQSFTLDFSDITLIDGFIPSVGEANRGVPLGQLPQIEPAIWFKILILEEVSIDCEKMDIMLTYDISHMALPPIGEVRQLPGQRAHQPRQRQRLTQSMYNSGEFHSEDLYEICSAVKTCSQDYKDNIIGIDSLNKELLRILHCSILPAINIMPYMLPRVEEAYANFAQHINAIDERIEERLDKTELLDQSRLRLLTQILKDCSDPGTDMSVEFAKTLHSDVEKSIREINRKLDMKQRHVEVVKQQYENGNSVESDIDQKRNPRDKDHEWQMFLLEGRERLHNFIEKSKAKGSSAGRQKPRLQSCGKEPVYNIYVEMNRQKQVMREDYQELVERKVMILSVNEALRGTVRQLKEKNSTPGIDTDKLSATRSTDVLRRSVIAPEWLMLQQKLARLLKDTTNPLSNRYNVFCRDIISVCDAALVSKDIHDFTLSPGDNTSRTDRESSTQNAVNHCGSAYNELIISNLKRVLFDHFDRMSGDLAQELKCDSPRDNRLRMWYESHVYQVVLPCLVQLYSKCYAETHSLLTSSLPSLSLSDIDLGPAGTGCVMSEAEAKDDDIVFQSSVHLSVAKTVQLHQAPSRDSTATDREDVKGAFSESTESDAEISLGDCSGNREKYPALTVIHNPGDIPFNTGETSGEDEQKNASVRRCVTSQVSAETQDRRMRVLPCYQELFKEARKTVKAVVTERVLLLKLRHLKECLQILTREVDQRTGRGSTADDVIDLVVVLLCHRDAEETADLYVHMMLMADLIPQCMQSGLSGFSLNQYFAGFQYVIDRINDKKRLSDTS